MDDCKILVVDNDPHALEVINDILLNNNSNSEILNASNGKTGYQIILNERPDLIISDWEMPEMSGLELIQNLQNTNDLKHIPVIICTGVMLEIKHLQQALDAGAVDYIRKPVNEIEMISRVKSLLRLTKLRNELIREKESHMQTKIRLLEEKLTQQTIELKSKALALGRYNSMLKSVAKELRTIYHQIDVQTASFLINDLLSKIDSTINNTNWSELQASFEELYPDFIVRLIELQPALSKSEIRLCILLKLNLSTKEIAALLNQSVRSLEMARHRLRQKLGLEKDLNFSGFFEPICAST